MTDQEALQKLQQIPIFEALRDDYESMEKLLSITKRISVPTNKTVIREGDVGAELYIVYSGMVEIRKRTRAGDNYTVVQLSAEQNVFFGELALIDDDKRSATVVTLCNSEFMVIHKKNFIRLGDQQPHIALPIIRAIATILANRLRKTTEDMLNIFDALVNELSA